jgi:hypothetical protein
MTKAIVDKYHLGIAAWPSSIFAVVIDCLAFRIDYLFVEGLRGGVEGRG